MEPLLRFIVQKDKVVVLHLNSQNFWEDDKFTVYGFIENKDAHDIKNRCGVWPFALPMWGIFEPINAGCGVHDFMYNNPVYQAFHSRETADTALHTLLTNREIGKEPTMIPFLFNLIVRKFGGRFWDNKENR